MVQLKSNLKQSPCYLLLLMPELRVQIASELDYFSLKHFGATCKANKELLKASIFDKPLFRSKAADFKLKSGMKVILHPLLHLISNLRIRSVKQAIIFPKGGDWRKAVSCVDLEAANENATFPPTKTVGFNSYLTTFKTKHFPGEVNAVGDRGVTVKQVIETIVRMWNTPCPMRKSKCGRFTMTVYEAIEIAFEDLKARQWPGWEESIAHVNGEYEGIVLRPNIWKAHRQPGCRIGISEYGRLYSMHMVGGDPFE